VYRQKKKKYLQWLADVVAAKDTNEASQRGLRGPAGLEASTGI
jgi:hypothetical protein